MTARRSRGDGGLYWSESRKRWIAEITIGYSPSGKRLTRKASGQSKTEAKNKLKQAIRDHDDGLTTTANGGTIADAVNDWLTYALNAVAPGTRDNYTCLARTHIIPKLGARKLRDLTALDVDRWLVELSKTLSTRTLRLLHSVLNRVIVRAMARDMVKRNVVILCSIPRGQDGRPSKSLTLEQAKAVIASARNSRLYAYVVLSILCGARTEELRALLWTHVDLDGDPKARPPAPPSIAVWRAERTGGDTKTRKSRRTLALPRRCVDALRMARQAQADDRAAAGANWRETGLVFTSGVGSALDASNVRRAFAAVVKRAGLDPHEWTPRELRHSFVSLLSDKGVRIEDIADLCGHSGTAVTETVYRHQLRPVLLDGAIAMDAIFDDTPDRATDSAAEHFGDGDSEDGSDGESGEVDPTTPET